MSLWCSLDFEVCDHAVLAVVIEGSLWLVNSDKPKMISYAIKQIDMSTQTSKLIDLS